MDSDEHGYMSLADLLGRWGYFLRYCILPLLTWDCLFGHFSSGINYKIICSRNLYFFWARDQTIAVSLSSQNSTSIPWDRFWSNIIGQELGKIYVFYESLTLCFDTQGNNGWDVLYWIIYYFVLTQWMRTSSLHGICIYWRWMGDVQVHQFYQFINWHISRSGVNYYRS